MFVPAIYFDDAVRSTPKMSASRRCWILCAEKLHGCHEHVGSYDVYSMIVRQIMDFML